MKLPEPYRHDNVLVPFVANDNKGWFRIPHYELQNHFFNTLADDVDGWQHVLVTVFENGRRPERCPTWEEMCFIKSIFWDDEETVMQLHPPKSEWVSNHPYCLHLWKPVNADIPVPPSHRVGLKIKKNEK